MKSRGGVPVSPWLLEMNKVMLPTWLNLAGGSLIGVPERCSLVRSIWNKGTRSRASSNVMLFWSL